MGKSHHMSARDVKRKRRALVKRDGPSCRICKSTMQITLDHIIPTSRGGKNTLTNLQFLCLVCNNRKGNKLRSTINDKNTATRL